MTRARLRELRADQTGITRAEFEELVDAALAWMLYAQDRLTRMEVDVWRTTLQWDWDNWNGTLILWTSGHPTPQAAVLAALGEKDNDAE